MLTEKKAIQETEKMFRKFPEYIMEKHIPFISSLSIKYRYFNDLNIPVTERPFANCYACQYDHEREEYYCDEYCILSEIWGGGKCISKISPYRYLLDALIGGNREEACRHSLYIADYCKVILEKMEENR